MEKDGEIWNCAKKNVSLQAFGDMQAMWREEIVDTVPGKGSDTVPRNEGRRWCGERWRKSTSDVILQFEGRE